VESMSCRPSQRLMKRDRAGRASHVILQGMRGLVPEGLLEREAGRQGASRSAKGGHR
jgi:hypothetical protein